MYYSYVIYHVTWAFRSGSTLRESIEWTYSCLNVKELLARNRCYIWNLSNSDGIQTRNRLVCKQTLNHLTKQDQFG